MKTVWKATLRIADGPQVVPVPAGARVVFVTEQHGYPALWFECDPEEGTEEWVFYVFGTGHPIPDDLVYVGTCLSHGGMLVWHIYGEVGVGVLAS